MRIEASEKGAKNEDAAVNSVIEKEGSVDSGNMKAEMYMQEMDVEIVLQPE